MPVKRPLNFKDRPFSTRHPETCEQVLANFRWRRGLTLANLENRLGYRVNDQYPIYDAYGRIKETVGADQEKLQQRKALRPAYKIRKWEKGIINNVIQEVPANMLLFELPAEFSAEIYDAMETDMSPEEVLTMLFPEEDLEENPLEDEWDFLNSNPEFEEESSLFSNFTEVPTQEQSIFGKIKEQIMPAQRGKPKDTIGYPPPDEPDEPEDYQAWLTILKRWKELKGIAYKRKLLNMFLFLIYTAE